MTVANGDDADEAARTTPNAPSADLGDLGRVIENAWSATAERRAAHAAEEEAARDAVLASDADRDLATRQLADGFAKGRLTRVDFEARTTRALSARTHGELDDVLHGLGGLKRTSPSHPVRKVVFWVVTVLTSPFLLLGVLLFAFGSDLGDHVGGLIVLGILGPAMFFLRRWAWPRPDRH